MINLDAFDDEMKEKMQKKNVDFIMEVERIIKKYNLDEEKVATMMNFMMGASVATMSKEQLRVVKVTVWLLMKSYLGIDIEEWGKNNLIEKETFIN